MSKRKKKKKVENLLKGVAITGATVGGASIMGDANLAYAHELSQSELAEDAIVYQVAQEQTQEVVENQMEADYSQQQEIVEKPEESEVKEVVAVHENKPWEHLFTDEDGTVYKGLSNNAPDGCGSRGQDGEEAYINNKNMTIYLIFFLLNLSIVYIIN